MEDKDCHVSAKEKASWNDKAPAVHQHTASEISDFPATMPPAAHTHAAGDIASGLLALARGGTGAGTAAGARSNLGAACTPVGILVTFPVSGWTAQSDGTYTQTVAAAGLLSADDKRTATVCSVGSTDKDAQALTDEAYNKVDRWSCDADGQLTARCPDGAPEVEFQAYVVIVR